MTNIDDWLADARQGAMRQVDEAEPTPDFADVLTRVRTLAPDLIETEMIAEVETWAPVVDESGNALDDFVSDARAALERNASMHHPRPNHPPVAPARRAPAWGWWSLGLTLAAASMIAFWGSAPTTTARPNGVLRMQALSSAIEPHRREAQAVTRAKSGSVTRAVDRAFMTPPLPAIEFEAQNDSLLEPSPSSTDDVATKPARPDPQALAEQAQQRWAQGDLAAAERLLRQVIRLAPRSELAQMAYADLFALVPQKQNNARDEQLKLWRNYLRRFPHGRFADDAFAALCRDDATDECWSGYLERFPNGSYRSEARRSLDAR